MWHEIILASEALEDLRRLSYRDRTSIRDALERHLRYEPGKETRSSLKRLRGVSRPQVRLRVGDFRVFYDVGEEAVEILAIVPKLQVEDWLREIGGQP